MPLLRTRVGPSQLGQLAEGSLCCTGALVHGLNPEFRGHISYRFPTVLPTTLD